MTPATELLRLAEAATPGKRTRTDTADYAEVTGPKFQAMVGTEADAEFLAASDRDTIKSLCERTLELEREVTELRKLKMDQSDQFSQGVKIGYMHGAEDAAMLLKKDN